MDHFYQETHKFSKILLFSVKRCYISYFLQAVPHMSQVIKTFIISASFDVISLLVIRVVFSLDFIY